MAGSNGESEKSIIESKKKSPFKKEHLKRTSVRSL